MARFSVGVDIGGTFTDLVVFEQESGALELVKALSTPSDFTRGVLDCLQKAAGRGHALQYIVFLSHGTTVATNALLEGKGSRGFLFITEGFRAIYEVGEQLKDEDGVSIYDLFNYEKPMPLIPQSRTLEVPERINGKGKILKPLDEAKVRAIARSLQGRGVESVAICLLFSFLEPSHEQRVEEIIREELPGVSYISTSHRVLPEIREFKRLSTVAVDAYVGPTLNRYLEKIEGALLGVGIHARPYIMHSGGGTMTCEAAKTRAVWCVESGPAAGVMAASFIAHSGGHDNVISFDMGGTTAKVGVVQAMEPKITTEFRAGRHLIGIPVIEMVEIGAGGGSIAWIDPTRALKVGPVSAGADPGPVCYGKGGAEPTVTDANVALGYYDPAYFLKGEMRLDKAAAEEAIRENIAKPLGLDLLTAANGIRQIVNSNMAEALRQVSVRKGYDPRDFIMVAFGGAGPAHACDLAREIGCPRVLVPLAAGVASALGLLTSEVKHDLGLSRIELLEGADMARVTATFRDLGHQAQAEMEAEGFHQGSITLERRIDLRYAGQGYELAIPVPGGALGEADSEVLIKAFHDTHERLTGHRAEGQPVQIVNYRVTAIGHLPKPELRRLEDWGPDPSAAYKGKRAAYFAESGGLTDTAIYERDKLRAGNVIVGPAIIEQMDCTTVVFPHQTAVVDGIGNLVINV